MGLPARVFVVNVMAVEHEFWHTRWQSGQIGFHRADVNPRLVAHRDVLPAVRPARVLVPLCGKSVDLAWLAEQGYEVIGVELSELAVRAFFDEHGQTPSVSPAGALKRFAAGPVTIYCGDFFALDRALLGDVDAVYDRAALVALPPELRPRYAAHMASLLPAHVVGLLVCFDYAQEQMSGPPFSVPEREVRALYGERFTVTLLASDDILDSEPRFRLAGLTALHELVYRIDAGARS